MSARHADVQVARLVARFEALTAEELPRLGEIYTQQVRFKDPFNEVQGLAAVQRIYQHMFDTLDAPRFIVHDIVAQDAQCFLRWDFEFRRRRRDAPTQRIHGSSHLRLTPEGLIAEQRDYWDAAEELYEQLPLLGSVLRWLKRRIRA